MVTSKDEPIIAGSEAYNGIVAVDPGSSSGAICSLVLGPTGQVGIAAVNMPDNYEDIFKLIDIKSMAHRFQRFKILWVIENVGGSMPGNAAKSARTFSEHMGALKMALIACDITHSWFVLPKAWMYGLYGEDVEFPKGMDNKSKRKDYIYNDMQKRWSSSFEFTKRQADAVGILTYAKNYLESKQFLEHKKAPIHEAT